MNTYDEQVREKISAIILDYAKEGEDAGDLDKTVDVILSLRSTLEKPIEGEWSEEYNRLINPSIHDENSLLVGSDGYAVEYPESMYELDMKKVESFIHQTILTERAKWEKETDELLKSEREEWESILKDA